MKDKRKYKHPTSYDYLVIENIGHFAYTWTILTGINREFQEFSNVKDGEIRKGEFIVTFGKKAVIVTEIQNNRRVPIIVKKWRKRELFRGLKLNSGFILALEHDLDNNLWSCEFKKGISVVASVTCKDPDGLLVYGFKQTKKNLI